MASLKELEELMAAGLGEYEARAYLALSSDGQIPSILAEKARIHRTKIYEALRGLEKKGLAEGIVDPTLGLSSSRPRKMWIKLSPKGGLASLNPDLVGLNLYERRVWFFGLDLALEKTPVQAADESGIPRTKAYAVLNGLESKGLASKRALGRADGSTPLAPTSKKYLKLNMPREDLMRLIGECDRRIAEEQTMRNKAQDCLDFEK